MLLFELTEDQARGLEAIAQGHRLKREGQTKRKERRHQRMSERQWGRCGRALQIDHAATLKYNRRRRDQMIVMLSSRCAGWGEERCPQQQGRRRLRDCRRWRLL
jgi:hypothetical protein